MHCTCAFYGPLVPPNTGILAIQKSSRFAIAEIIYSTYVHILFDDCRNSADFRIALTGTVLELDATSSVVKKLKLVGSPVKIFKNTAFIHGNSINLLT
jgi:ribosome biogenesis protein BMS1